MLSPVKDTYMLKIILAEDHKLVRDGIKMLLGTADTLEVVGEAANGQAVLDLLEGGAIADLVLARRRGGTSVCSRPRMGSAQRHQPRGREQPQKADRIYQHSDQRLHVYPPKLRPRPIVTLSQSKNPTSGWRNGERDNL